MTIFAILDELEATSSSSQKKAILKEHKNNQELQDLLSAALNFKRKFFVKKFDENKLPKNYKDILYHETFMELLNKLETRQLTGNDAVAAIEEFIQCCSENKAKWYSRIIRKDLKAGFSASTAIKCGYNIPKFDVQLAKDGRLCKKVDEILKKGAYTSPKLDGYRCIAVLENGAVTLYSRNGTVFENFPTIEKSLVDLWWNEKHNSKYIFDGEIMSSDFNKTQQSAFASKRGTVVGDVSYFIFDMIPANEWNSDKFTTPAHDRYTSLEILFQMSMPHMEHKQINNIKLVPHKCVSTLDEITEAEKFYIEDGFEGVMLNPNIPYYRGKKSNKMLKFKTMKSMEATITACYEGRPDTKYVGTLGGFTVTQEGDEDGIGAGVSCDVGSGLSDDERDSIWKNRDAMNGRMIEVKYQDLTDGDQRMRFPIFVRWRPDKD